MRFSLDFAVEIAGHFGIVNNFERRSFGFSETMSLGKNEGNNIV